MMRALALMLLVCAGSASAQATKAPATKAPATKAAPDTKAGAATKAAGGSKAAPGTKAPGPAQAAEPLRLPVILREVYSYDPGGRRDPYVSLLQSAELRPTVTDLKLVGILYDETGRRPVAIMRDATSNVQYRVTTGMTLGRLRVTSIRRRAVIFTIEEFGLNRQDSLVLGDTSKARAR